MTGIEWAEEVWNPTTGCDRISDGCDNCYALKMAGRLKKMGQVKYQNDGSPRTSGPGFGVTMHPDALEQPFRWTRPRRVFVNSMSDLFHDSVPDGFIAQVWDVMGRTPWHTYMILTKRHARMRSWVSRWADTSGDAERRRGDRTYGMPPMPRGPVAVRATYESGRALLFADMLDSMGTPPEGCAYPLYDWMEGQRFWPAVLPNVWLGVSAEDQKWADIRIPALLDTPAAVRFVSAEPLLGRIDLRAHLAGSCPEHDFPGGFCVQRGHPGVRHLNWLIVGGESGPGARPMDEEWARTLAIQAVRAKVPVFVKQLGSVLGKQLGAGPKGGDWDMWPEDLKLRQFPRVPEMTEAS